MMSEYFLNMKSGITPTHNEVMVLLVEKFEIYKICNASAKSFAFWYRFCSD